MPSKESRGALAGPCKAVSAWETPRRNLGQDTQKELRREMWVAVTYWGVIRFYMVTEIKVLLPG